MISMRRKRLKSLGFEASHPVIIPVGSRPEGGVPTSSGRKSIISGSWRRSLDGVCSIPTRLYPAMTLLE